MSDFHDSFVLSRPDRLGDLVISTSCLYAMRQAYPQSRLVWVVSPGLQVLLAGHPAIDELLVTGEDLRGQLEALGASAIVHLHEDESVMRAAYQAGIPRRLGFYVGDRSYLTEGLLNEKRLGQVHEAEWNYRLLELLGKPLPRLYEPWLEVDEVWGDRLRAQYDFFEEGYVCFHMQSHGDKPRWPIEHFIELGRRVLRKGYRLVLVGAQQDDSMHEQLRAVLGDAVLDWAGQTTLPELAFVLRQALAVVSRDSGPAHLAGALGVPVVSLMGQCEQMHSPKRWSVLGEQAITLERNVPKRFWESRAARWRRNFQAITPDEVEGALLRWLG